MITIMTGTDTCATTIVTITDRHLLSLCRRFAGQRRAWWLAAWMIVCLLLSQQIGWSHGIHHMTVAPVQVQAIDGAGQPHAAHHSCLLFDAACSAVAFTASPPQMAPVVASFSVPVPGVLRSPDLPVSHPFRSRAPPHVVTLI